MASNSNELSVFVQDCSKQPPKFTVAYIQYKNIDGCHVFTSKQIDGLFIVTKDPQEALEQIVPTIKELLKLKSGSEYEAILGEEFSLFGQEHGFGENHLILDDTCVAIRKVA